MHRCRNCNIAISQICHCNTEDPHSDNPMHRVHINEKDCAPTKAHVCEKCGKNAKSEEALRCHMKAAHPKFSCPDCDNMYNIFEDYEAHKDLHRELRPRKKQRIELVSNEDTWDVDAMDDSYTDKNFELSKEDEKTLEDDEEDGFSFNCETCSFKTNLEKDLKHHKKCNHNLQKKVQSVLMKNLSGKNTKTSNDCRSCGSKFSRAFNLKRHQEKFHPE